MNLYNLNFKIEINLSEFPLVIGRKLGHMIDVWNHGICTYSELRLAFLWKSNTLACTFQRIVFFFAGAISMRTCTLSFMIEFRKFI